MGNRYILVYSGNIVIPDMAAWIVSDITDHGLSITRFRRKVYCNTTIQALLSSPEFDDIREQMYARYQSPKKITAVMVSPQVDLLQHTEDTPGIDERIKQAHTGINPIDLTLDFVMTSETQNNSEFVLWESLLFS